MVLKHLSAFIVCCWILVIGICGMLLCIAFRALPTDSTTFICGNAFMNNAVSKRNDSTFADGKALFQSNCASCHNPVKDATGPALADIITFRSQKWICKFLTKRKFMPDDARAVRLRKQFGLTCMKFPQLSCEEVQSVVRYVDCFRQ